ncbi:hypothetical protein A2V61_04220 [Candidatus Woesebacteria bacterium RBG_19FT_COMBO_47_8]|uniref:Fibronectin type-III domain-containing protein n=1 Tax=Candidatus Woesebacteria bacterium RBG_13_46_13 TaxID=1802479 RepID=A0A1F7X7M8_9BACT|nr:MAG: hypothetical protein A2Y68_02900 [Candidatus Woesebacteria bacterium RBG_13_46_13]OGM16931.1 MAG: hypothetical protein A2V61_04220 [Candidatus Woesebacteria bacterium RBG_19FT_COMBO_47_8]HJX59052.1 hypothetical protein [Patescibacteria group bacterium]
MQKTKIATLLLGFLAGFVLLASPVSAASVSITNLPEYVTVDHFKLSCTALVPGGSSAQFAFKKEGGSFSNFGPSIDLDTTACLVDVTSTQIDSQAKYYFRVDVNGTTAETSTTYDVSGPSAPRDYGKEKIGNTTYKIRWTNPGESDFAQVFIYRGETNDFSADNDKKIAQVGGAHDAEMSYIDNGVAPDKTYYYILRALDKAGNSSSLIGDTQTTTVLGTTTTAAGGQTGTVRVLPKEETEGEVLPEATEAPTKAPEASSAVTEAVGRISSSKTLTGLAIAAFILGLASYYILRSKNR